MSTKEIEQNNEKDQPSQQGAEEDCTAITEEIIEKLKLLNYEKEFLAKKGLKPVVRGYFAISLNPNEQFNYFKTLVKWLFQLVEVQSSDYTKYDDPITVSSNIQAELKKAGIESDFPPVKLKTGSGDQVCNVLLALVNKALKKKFNFKKAKIDDIQAHEEEPIIDQEGDQNLELGDNLEASDEEPDENIIEGGNQKEIDEEKKVLDSRIERNEWILECERVSSKLRFVVKSDAKEWRSHIESSKTYNENIKKLLPESRATLEKISDELGKLLEKIGKREKNINVNMNELGSEYKKQAEELKQITLKYNNLNLSVREMGDKYRELSEKFETVQIKTNDHGNSVSDSSPVMKIKAAIQKLRYDLKGIDLRIGVLNHTVTQHKCKEKKFKKDGEVYDGIGNYDQLEEEN